MTLLRNQTLSVSFSPQRGEDYVVSGEEPVMKNYQEDYSEGPMLSSTLVFRL